MIYGKNMSRIGLKPITIPQGVEVSVVDGGKFHFKEVKVKGPKGEISESLRRGVTVEITDGVVNVARDTESKQNKSYHGLYRSIISNMIDGVVSGFSKDLEIVGIGYRAEQQGEKVVFSVGYSHKIDFVPPQGITVTVTDQTKISVTGYDKQKVGEVASKIRAFRKPEPYKGKGIRYANEQVRKKSAKSVS